MADVYASAGFTTTESYPLKYISLLAIATSFGMVTAKSKTYEKTLARRTLEAVAKELKIPIHRVKIPGAHGPKQYAINDADMERLKTELAGERPGPLAEKPATVNAKDAQAMLEFQATARKLLHMMEPLSIFSVTLQDGHVEFSQTITHTVQIKV